MAGIRQSSAFRPCGPDFGRHCGGSARRTGAARPRRPVDCGIQPSAPRSVVHLRPQDHAIEALPAMESAGVTETVTTRSEAETSALGRELAQTLSAGDVVLLFGDLGAGKTAFVKGLAEGLGVARDEVSSPTFTLVQEYRGGRLTLFHVELYGLHDQRDLDDLGLDEIADDGVLAIEWADKLDARLNPSRSITIHLEKGYGE